MQQQTSKMNIMIWNLTAEFFPYVISFKVINVLFPSTSRAHGNQERLHHGLSSYLSLRLRPQKRQHIVTLVMVSTMSVDVTRGWGFPISL